MNNRLEIMLKLAVVLYFFGIRR